MNQMLYVPALVVVGALLMEQGRVKRSKLLRLIGSVLVGSGIPLAIEKYATAFLGAWARETFKAFWKYK